MLAKMAASDDPHPQSWYTTNFVGVPAPAGAARTSVSTLASAASLAA